MAELDVESVKAARRLSVVCLSTSAVDAIIAALEDCERLREAAQAQRDAEDAMLSVVPVGGHGKVESRLVTEWIEAGAKLQAALKGHDG